MLTGLLLDRDVWLTAMAVVPACLLGIWVARRIFLRISRDALLRAVALLLLAYRRVAYFSSSALSASRSRRTHCVSSANFSSLMPGWRKTVSSTSAPSPLGKTRIGT